jgi:hypothetical protein
MKEIVKGMFSRFPFLTLLLGIFLCLESGLPIQALGPRSSFCMKVSAALRVGKIFLRV